MGILFNAGYCAHGTEAVSQLVGSECCRGHSEERSGSGVFSIKSSCCHLPDLIWCHLLGFKSYIT